MRKSKELSFIDDRKKNTKRVKSFIIAFCAFVVVLGAVSLLMFMKHLNFDLSNLLSSAETTTEEVSETTTEPLKLEGNSNILIMCENTSGELDFAFLVNTDYPSRTMTVRTVDTGKINGINKNSGAAAARDEVASATGVTVDRYIKFNTSRFRSFLNKFEDITVNVENDIDDAQNGLILNKGAQALSAELFIKYLDYCQGEKKADAFAQFLKVVLSPKHTGSHEALFSYIANNSQTDLSIVDFKSHQEKLAAFSDAEGKITAFTEE